MDDIRYVRCMDVVCSFSKGARCFRSAGKGGGVIALPESPVQRVPPGIDWRIASVYMYQLSPALLERWPYQRPGVHYVVAISAQDVEKYLSERFGRIAENNMGTAKTALGIAMSKVSTRPVSMTGLGGNAKRAATRFVEVLIEDGSKVYRVRVDDDLSYAVSAIKGGEQAISTALMKAANSVAGRIRHSAAYGLNMDVPTPFPEVARKGRKSA